MEGSGDDRCFRVSFSVDGLKNLRNRVRDKLKEFMGDYTDDTFAEYVIVLLRNGRRKDEARKELDVFLGDDSTEFVSWLWDHLSSNVHLYVQQQQEPSHDDFSKGKSTLNELPAKRDLGHEYLTPNVHSDFGHERDRPRKVSRGRHGRGWKGLVHEDTEVFPLRSVVADILHSEDSNRDRSSTIARHSKSRSGSPVPQVYRKRSHDCENPPEKKDSAVAAPRRLLQFAVRDAVKTVQQSNSRTEPPLKRLRSVVSAKTLEVEEKKSHRTRPGSRMFGALSTAVKAAAEAAEDVNRSRTTGNVFDRLGHGRSAVNLPLSSEDQAQERLEYEDFDRVQYQVSMGRHSGEYDDDFVGHMTILEKDTEMTDSAFDDNAYDNYSSIRHQGLVSSRREFSATKGDKSVAMEYSIAAKHDEDLRKQMLMDQNLPVSSASMTSSKIANISVNVNTWKSSQYKVQKDFAHVKNTGIDAGKLSGRLTKENNASQNVKNMEISDAKKEFQKVAAVPGLHNSGRPLEDVDSRTLFVSNVHFAATKDTLSRHFNKYGDVLKVIIVTDAATGQPTGSAYVEFLKKDSADLALALNGTSFMSRIMKVVRRSTHEASPALGWSSVAKSSAFPSSVGRMAYPRGLFPGAFRARLPVKAGARSLQWKREPTAQSGEGTKGPTSTSLASGNNFPLPTSRSLTYTRTECTANATTGPA